MPHRTCPCLLVLLAATGLPALDTWDSGDPTAAEQYVLELVNRARANPTAEGTRLSITITEGLSAGDAALVDVRAPLAMNKTLLAVARTHSQDMWTRNYFDHNTLEGTTPFQRMTTAGYSYLAAGENIATSSNNTAAALEDLLMVDAGITGRGHRKNLLDIGISYREVGIGFYHNASTNGSGYRDFLTQDFGRSATGPFVVGVVYSDTNGNGFYDIGEGLSGVIVTPSAGSWCAVTGQAGGYAFPYSLTGSITVTFSGGGLAGTITKTVSLGTANVKQDARASEVVAGGGTAPTTPVAAASVSNASSATPTLSGTTEAGANVTIYDGSTAIGVATANGSGAWSWTPITPLAAGVHSLTWTASNGSGTSGQSPPTTVTAPASGGSGSTGDTAAGGGGCGAGGGAAGLLLALFSLGLRRRPRGGPRT